MSWMILISPLPHTQTRTLYAHVDTLAKANTKNALFTSFILAVYRHGEW